MLHPLFSPFLFKNTIKNKLITMLMNSCTRMECRDIVAVAAHDYSVISHDCCDKPIGYQC